MKRAFLLFLLLAGCSNASAVAGPSAGGEPVGSVRQAVGEQQNGFPSPWERATFMAAKQGG
jgi:hypothetical protein